MKQRKNIVLLALFTILLTLLCFFAACDEAPEGKVEEKTLDDFVYLTEINTDHTITDDELAVMNNIWRREFGKDLAADPEEAMKRSEEGNFYFGRYGKTFVFFRYRFYYDVTMQFREYEFKLPQGRLYFIHSDRVYDLEQIAKTDIFTDRQLKAFYDFYQDTYLNYKPTITLDSGDYILTEDDLAMMHKVYGRSDRFTGIDTLENAMQRRKNGAYYFGKYGDTVIIWSTMFNHICPQFTLGGYEFDFLIGSVLFFKPSGAYFPDDPKVEDILTAEEKQEFYGHYTERYLPFVTLPYTYLEFTPDLEELTDEEMRSIDAAYAEWKYEQEYDNYYQTYTEAKYTPENAAASADRAALNRLGPDPHRFFNEENFTKYQYWGKRGSKVFISAQEYYNVLKIVEIAGYKFFFDGSADILVFEDGKLTELAEAYEQGTVKRADVAFANERHTEYSAYLIGGKEEIPPPARLKIAESREASPIILTEEEKREIVWEYIADSGRLEEDIEATYAVRCYGKFGDAYAVMIDGPWGYLTAVCYETAAEYTFVFPDAQTIEIYKDGVFYSIRKAYELGIISKKNVSEIQWNNVVEPYTYKKSSAPIDIGEEEIASIINSYTRDGAGHKNGAVYSLRCYGKAYRGYAAFVDCSDKTYKKVETVENVGGYEFIYPTEQTMLFCYNWGSTSSLTSAFESEWLTEYELKMIYESYRADNPELYK